MKLPRWLQQVFHRHHWTQDGIGNRCCLMCGKAKWAIFIEHKGERRIIGYR